MHPVCHPLTYSLIQTMSDSPQPLSSVTIKRPAGLQGQLSMLSAKMHLGEKQRHDIKSLFNLKPKYVCVYDTEFQTDVCFSFWGFLNCENAIYRLISFLCWCLQPRMYMAGFVSPGRLEAVMIVRMSRLCITRSDFEKWLDILLNVMNISAGSHFFSKYMDEQMLTCLQRIETTKNRMTNMLSEMNKDFRLLYTVLSKHRKEAKRASYATGVELDATRFINLFFDNQRLVIENNQLSRTLKQSTEELSQLRSLAPDVEPSLPVMPVVSGRVVILQRTPPSPGEDS